LVGMMVSAFKKAINSIARDMVHLYISDKTRKKYSKNICINTVV